MITRTSGAEPRSRLGLAARRRAGQGGPAGRAGRAGGAGRAGRGPRTTPGPGPGRPRHADAMRLLSIAGPSRCAAGRPARVPATAAAAVAGCPGIAQFAAAAGRGSWRIGFECRRKVTYQGERTGIARRPLPVRRANFTLPLGHDVANVTTAGPGVQVENVSARGRRTRYQRVPGSLVARVVVGGAYSGFSAFSSAGLSPSADLPALSVPSMTASATLRMVRRRSIEVF